MDIFKLFFNHDQRLDKLAKRNANKTPQEVEATLADFMAPTPTYSKFYLTGTRLQEELFGINQLQKYEAIIQKIDTVFKEFQFYAPSAHFPTLSEALAKTPVGHPLLFCEDLKPAAELASLIIDDESNVGHYKEELSELLQDGTIVLYKEQAKNGFDLHLFSKKNIYPSLFYPLQELVDDSFRFFSINSKRMRSERHFYFETWTLGRPPHGAEEVFPATVL